MINDNIYKITQFPPITIARPPYYGGLTVIVLKIVAQLNGLWWARHMNNSL